MGSQIQTEAPIKFQVPRPVAKSEAERMASGADGGEGKRRRRWQRRLSGAACLPRPGCFTVSAAGEDEGTSASGAGEGENKPKPTHLVVTVNGIVGR
jgi:hypothetical protein